MGYFQTTSGIASGALLVGATLLAAFNYIPKFRADADVFAATQTCQQQAGRPIMSSFEIWKQINTAESRLWDVGTLADNPRELARATVVMAVCSDLSNASPNAAPETVIPPVRSLTNPPAPPAALTLDHPPAPT